MIKNLAGTVQPILAAVMVGLTAASLAHASPSGSYLAAMQADFRDDYQPAARYYAEILARDPENIGLLQNATVMSTASGDMEKARQYADRLIELAPGNQLAALVRLADLLAEGDFEASGEILETSGNTLNPLLRGLVSGWIDVGREDFSAAQEEFDAMTGNAAIAAYGQYHKALALALAGDFVSSERLLQGNGNGPLHLNRGSLLAHAEILAQIGKETEAQEILDNALSGGVPDAALIDLRDRLSSGEEVAFRQIADARGGAAESFLTLAEALDTQESARISLIHARLAAHIRPDLYEAQLLAAEILEDLGQYDLAEQTLQKISQSSPWYVTAVIRKADTQRAAGDPEAGVATLTELAAAQPDEIPVHSALGDALRDMEDFVPSAEAYDRAIALIGEPQQAHWVLFYTRGISNERSGNWQQAEADFRQALELQPDQPLVLNYLGYSLVEKRTNLDEALNMIETAVAGRPDDGYITDSLGWVLYRLGRYEEAVPHMLRAVELTPDDPIINDHLGDVLWSVGRKREAEFQWRRALSFGPADDLDMDRVRRKLKVGLDQVLEESGGINGG